MNGLFIFAIFLAVVAAGAIIALTHPTPQSVSFQQAAIACEGNAAYTPTLQGQCLEDYVEARR